MIRTLMFVFLLLLVAGSITAQIPGNISVTHGALRSSADDAPKLLCNNFAGTLTLGSVIGQSNDGPPGVIYLCFGDTLPITHNGNANLSGDPQPATAPGIGYAFYDCIPSVSGTTLQAVQQDPCLNRTSPIIINGIPVPQDPTNMMWVATDQPNGNAMFINNGLLQSAYNNGVPAPRQFWFAPITLDDFATRGFENSGGTAGPCVHVNTAAAFSVVYLNAITISNITNNLGAGECSGSFQVSGGLPEFDPTATYTYQLTLTTNPLVRGTVTSSAGHNGLVEFTVPQPGTYAITVSDGKSCSAFGTVDMSSCTAVTFSLPLTNGAPGTNICLDVRVENFNNVGAFQFSMQWDPAILQFTNVQGFNPALLGFDQNAFNTTAPLTGTGRLTVSWADLSFMGVSVPNGSSIFQLCFDVIGSLGSFSNVTFTNSPTNIEIGDAGLNSYGFVGRPGIVNVSTSQLFVNLTQDSVSCASINDGAFTLTVANGTPPYVFNWSSLAPLPPQNGGDAIPVSGGSFTVSNRQAGAYRLVITDSSVPAITVIDTVRVLRGPALGVLMEVTPPTCNGLNNGAVRAVISLDGVVTPNPSGYTFTWNQPGAPNGPQITGLPFGFYAVTITDPSGCTAMASATMTQPPPLNAVATITNAACTGSANGFINVVVNGGTPSNGNYNFSWSGGLGTVIASSSTVANLNPGQYCLTITDANGCISSDCYTVGAVKTLNINAAVTDITCNGSCNGAILVNGSTSGAPAATPYTFSWSANLGSTPVNTTTSSNVAGLCAGTYSVTMSDADPTGCRVVRSFTLQEPAPVVVALLQQVNETCTIGNDGRAVPGITGGTAPYTFAWRNAQQIVVSTDSIASGLTEGSYTLLVTDARSCTGTLTVNILAPTPPNITPIVTDTISCAGNSDGALTVSAGAGSAPIASYSWSNGMNGAAITGLSPGSYQVTVTAQDACFSVATGMVVAPAPLVIDSLVTVSPTCPGNSNGRITVFARGGTGPYRYIWANQPQPDTLLFSVYPSRAAGTYFVTVVDANNCNPVSASVTVTDPPAIQINFSAIQAVTCFDGPCNGQATAMAQYSNGSTGTFLFNWASGTLASGVSTSSVANLCGGYQTLVVTDAANCFTVDSVLIPSPPAINIFVDAQPVSCNSGNDGRVTLNVSGGTPGYQYLWIETGSTMPTINNLAAGQYNAVITDANGCVKAQRVQISEPDELILTVDVASSTANVTCSGSTDGVIRVFYNSADNINPVGPNPFTWSGNIAPASASLATNLSPGTYSVTITDTKGCRDSVTYTIASPPPIVAVIPPPADPRCFGEATVIIIDTIYGGNGTALIDYTYEVDNNGLTFLPDQPASVFAGPHTITIEDPAGCQLTIQVVVNQPQQLQVIFDPAEIEVELGDTTVRLNPLITSSLPIATYAWTPANTLSDPTLQRPRLLGPLNDQDYELVVTDINGCTASGVITVEVDKNRNVYIPNAFSPNGDGPNDEFRIFACLGVANINSVRIFDRWGGMVFEQADVQPDCIGGARLWDGSVGSQRAAQGVYIYLVEVTFVDGITLLYRGDVSILR
jgi:gliding motility-associated-like protein